MKTPCLLTAVGFVLSTLAPFAAIAAAAESAALVPVTLETVTDPGPNTADEPLATEFSLEQAVHFLDSAALVWQKQRKCFTCHTNYAYLYARPLMPGDSAAHQSVREFAEQLVTGRWEKEGPRWDAEIVATAAALAFNDHATTGRLSAATRTALDRIWTVQREDGGFSWLNCDWPPMESDDHYGVTLAALAVGIAPEEYATSESAQAGVDGLRRYLRENDAPTLHHRAMLLWAAQHLDGLVAADRQADTIAELRSRQHEDGGWALAALGDWERADGSPQDVVTSDGYGTGFVVFILRQAGVPANDPAITRGIGWLKSHQRESGRWFTRSLHKDSKHFINHAGTAFDVMAIASCENQPHP